MRNVENSRGLSCTALSSRQLITPLPSVVVRIRSAVSSSGSPKNASAPCWSSSTILRRSTPTVAVDSPPMAWSSALPSSPVRYCSTAAQVVEVDEREPGLVGVVEHQRQRRRLRLVGAEHLGEELGTERRHRGAHRHPGAEAAEGEERHRMPARRPLDAELGDALAVTWSLGSPGCSRPERSPFTSAANTGTPIAESCSAMSCSVFVLPVPVAPAIRPCRLHMLAGTCTTASGTTEPSSIPRPSKTAAPSVAYAAAIRGRTPLGPSWSRQEASGRRNSAAWSSRPTSPSCSCATARRSGAAPGATRRTRTSR